MRDIHETLRDIPETLKNINLSSLLGPFSRIIPKNIPGNIPMLARAFGLFCQKHRVLLYTRGVRIKGRQLNFLEMYHRYKKTLLILFFHVFPPNINALLHSLHPAFKYLKEASLAELSEDPLHGLFEALFIVKTLAC